MRYFYERPRRWFSVYGSVYECEHPAYVRCTLYFTDGRGLGVIQQRYNPKTKATYWTEIDPWLVDDIYMREGFKRYFERFAEEAENGLFPTVTVRQIMWALKMKPMKKEPWETVFDRSPI